MVFEENMVSEIGRARLIEIGCKSRCRHICNNDTEMEKEYVRMKKSQRNESFSDGSVGVRVRLMVRGGCLPVRGNERMAWQYNDCRCGCGLVEPEMHVLFECTLYERERWRGAVGYLKDGYG